MGRNTPIEWTDDSWPCLAGCKEISPGCANCYSARLTATRLSKTPKYQGLAVVGQNGHPHFTGASRLWPAHLDWPLRWKAPRRIFVADMSDLFYEKVTNEEIAAVFGVMAACPQHTFQVLTKRADRMRDWFRWARGAFTEQQRGIASAPHTARAMLDAAAEFLGTKHDGLNAAWRRLEEDVWPLPNVWLGVSVENQKYADERIPELLAAPAAVRFVSYEPALEAVDFDPFIYVPTRCPSCASTSNYYERTDMGEPGIVRCGSCHAPTVEQKPLDWIIVGGESGPGARPFDVGWARSTIEQCRAAGVACFFKQAGSRPILDGAPLVLRDRKGGDLSELPVDLHVREFPRG